MTTVAAPVPGVSTAAGADRSRIASQENLREAGERFEGIFIGMMLKSMRSASLGSDLLGSEAMTRFREMQDVKTSETMAGHMPLGIGQAMIDFLSQGRPELKADG